MDYEKLIEQLKNLEACAYGYHINGEVLGMDCSDFEQVMVDAATAISTLQAENEKLRAEQERVKRERDAAIRDLEMVSVCDTCVHEHAPSCPGCNDAENWEWRGPEEG